MHIVAYSSLKVLSKFFQSSSKFFQSFFQSTFKATSYFDARLLFLWQWKVYVLPRFRHKTSTVVRREGEMNKRKLGCFALSAMLLALCVSAEAQQPKKVPRIGVLSPSSSGFSPLLDAFRQGLRELGYIEGQNIAIEYRFAEVNPASRPRR